MTVATSDGQDRPVILFDGVCNLCSAWVRFVIDRDPTKRFRFAALQSAVAGKMLEGTEGTEGTGGIGTIVLIERGRYLTRSDAVLAIARHLSAPWPALAVFRIVPRFLRDACYDLVARNRYRWFGRQATCMVPTPELRGRFLD